MVYDKRAGRTRYSARRLVPESVYVGGN
jgi:hypothetical protein